jgi:hypothetical protein
MKFPFSMLYLVCPLYLSQKHFQPALCRVHGTRSELLISQGRLFSGFESFANVSDSADTVVFSDNLTRSILYPKAFLFDSLSCPRI